MAVTEPGSGTDTTRIGTTAVRRDGRYSTKLILAHVTEHVLGLPRSF